MNLCSDGHDEVAFEGRQRDCPACKIIYEFKEYREASEKEVKDLNCEIANLNEKLNEPVVLAIHQAQASLV